MQQVVTYLRSHNLAVTHQEYPIPHGVSAAQRQDVSQWLKTQGNAAT